jgi:Mn-containing catalase
VTIAGGGGVNVFDSMGNAWTSTYLKITGELDVDLRSNIAAEARAKIVHERLIDHTDDPGTIDTLQFLMTREITHRKAFQAALDSLEKSPFSVGLLKPTPRIVDEYFNGSTGDGNEGDTDMRGPWTASFGLHPVESQMAGGKGLSVGDVNGKSTVKIEASKMTPKRPPLRRPTKRSERACQRTGKQSSMKWKRMPS